MIINSFLVALALAMDAFAVSIGSGVKLDKVGTRETLRVAWHFGLFQLIFFMTGSFLGTGAFVFIGKYADIVSFLILFFLGVHMFYVTLKKDEPEILANPTKGKNLILLAVATSLDALAAGFSIGIINDGLRFTASCVFLVTFLLCAFGIMLGDRISNAGILGEYSEKAGGVILVLLSFKFFHIKDFFF